MVQGNYDVLRRGRLVDFNEVFPVNNLRIVDTQTGAQDVDQHGSVVEVVPSSQPIIGVLPFPVEVQGHAQLLLRRKPCASKRSHHSFPVSIGDCTVLP